MHLEGLNVYLRVEKKSRRVSERERKKEACVCIFFSSSVDAQCMSAWVTA